MYQGPKEDIFKCSKCDAHVGLKDIDRPGICKKCKNSAIFTVVSGPPGGPQRLEKHLSGIADAPDLLDPNGKSRGARPPSDGGD